MAFVTFTTASTTTAPAGWTVDPDQSGQNGHNGQNLFDGIEQVAEVTEVQQTEVPPAQPEVEVMPESEPAEAAEPEPDPQPETPDGEDQVKQAKGALYTAALIIKAASDDIAEAQATLEQEKADQQEWARNLVRDAWALANEKGHCSTWDSVMRAVGLPSRPARVTFTVTGRTKTQLTRAQLVSAFAAMNMEVPAATLTALTKDKALEALVKKHRYSVGVQPDVPDDPFSQSTACLCPQARREFLTYVEQVETGVTFDEVVVENQNMCPAKTHEDGIAPKPKRK